MNTMYFSSLYSIGTMFLHIKALAANVLLDGFFLCDGLLLTVEVDVLLVVLGLPLGIILEDRRIILILSVVYLKEL